MTFQRYKIYPRVLEDLENRSTVGMYFYLVITLVVLSVNGFYQRHPVFSGLFFAAMVIIAGFRIFQFYHFRRLNELNKDFNTRAFFASVYATALTWGVGFAYFMLQPGESASHLLMVTSTAGLTAGGVVAFIPAWRVSVLYTVFMIGPAVIIMTITRTHLPVVFLFLLYGLYLPIIASRGNREYWDALENEHLLKVKSEEIEKLSRIDGLTGLYNRRYFEEIFNQQWKTAARNAIPISIIIGDVDYFKTVNDTYGHQAGDAFLQEIARLLGRIIKRETDVIARYGGEEFVILLLNLDTGETRKLAEQIRSEMENLRFPYEGQHISATISLGAASCIPGKQSQKEEFLKAADEALYRAKNLGRNHVIFSDKTLNPPDSETRN